MRLFQYGLYETDLILKGYLLLAYFCPFTVQLSCHTQTPFNKVVHIQQCTQECSITDLARLKKQTIPW